MFSGCSSSVIRSDFNDINPKDKSVVDIVKALIEKGYGCKNVEPSKREVDAFLKSGHKIIKISCAKQTNGLFCVNNHFVYLYQDAETKEGLVLNGNNSPVCIWTK